jgi:isoaspartyl peptidase/L-asparaginase-like protein (Ntn-hydrolase superfamily)
MSRRGSSSISCLVGLFLLGACGGRAEPLGEVPAATVFEPAEDATVAGPLVLAHGGQGSPASKSDGPAAAAAKVLAELDGGTAPMDAAVAGIMVLEDDPRFNAGTGANLRLDGRTIETDAAIMDDARGFGAVTGLSGIKNPIRVARAVIDSPHILLAGPGAKAFADTLGLEQADLRTEQAHRKIQRGWGWLMQGERWSDYDWRARWNFDSPLPATMEEVAAMLHSAAPAADPGPENPAGEEVSDTVGVVLRTSDGHYVAALSTGGTTLALRGRVGDVPQLGGGLYAGPAGAVATTGKGEAIARERVAVRTYELLAQGIHPREAIRRAARGVKISEGVGVIAVSELGYGAAATTQMAWAAASPERMVRADTVITR